jgi:arylsulfatase
MTGLADIRPRAALRIRVLAGFALALAACGSSAPAPRARRVILITCDTLRADRLGCYGYARPTSPHLDEFAREAVVFDNAWSTAPKTTPAVSALLTGRLPDEIGVTGGNRYLLPPAAVTLAELAREAGWHTGAVVSNWVLRDQPKYGGAGVQQGFEHFDDRMDLREISRDVYERLAPATTDAAIAWLEERRARGEDRFFFWVHYQDPHGPYRPPAEILARFERPATAEPELPVGKTQRGFGQIPSYQALDSERRPEPYRARYDAEIAAFDEHFGRLLAWLHDAEWTRDALIVFTADHGESLGEQGYWFCHGENLHAEIVHVPLLVHFPEESSHVHADERGRVARPAGHLDLWPTILEALAVPEAGSRGLSLFQEELPERRFLKQTLGRLERDRWLALGDGRWRLVARSGEPPQLYDHASDPSEKVDLAAREPDVVRELQRLHAEDKIAHPYVPLKEQRIEGDAETEHALNTLGYGGDED